MPQFGPSVYQGQLSSVGKVSYLMLTMYAYYLCVPYIDTIYLLFFLVYVKLLVGSCQSV